MGKAHCSLGVYNEIAPELIGIPLNWVQFPAFKRERKVMQSNSWIPRLNERIQRPLTFVECLFRSVTGIVDLMIVYTVDSTNVSKTIQELRCVRPSRKTESSDIHECGKLHLTSVFRPWAFVMKVLYPMKDCCHKYIFVYVYLAETRARGIYLSRVKQAIPFERRLDSFRGRASAFHRKSVSSS